ncbi:hypothetical protein lerEdw1_016309 [Lerista edwardsae]|nr:hypothetical protein lerEdw1_016309 [Lerista edwardsae]
MLISPLGKRAYSNIEHAKSACLLEEKCSGISYWKKEYIPVSGKELIIPLRKHVTTYMKTACSEGHFGSYCHKCLECPKEHPCNRLTGKCAGEVICQEKVVLSRCDIKLKSKYCYHSWIYNNGYCYYIPQFGLINKSDAEYMCSHFEKARLLHLSGFEEKRDPLGSPYLGLFTKSNLWRKAKAKSYLASASKRVDAPPKWWVSMVASLVVSSVVTVATVLITFKLGFLVPEKANEMKPQTL